MKHYRIQDGCHHQVESEWMCEVFCADGGNQSWQVWVTIERKYYHGWIQDGQILDVRIQVGCHHQVKWEWMSLSQIELVWFRVRVEWECFWVNLRKDNKVSESKMAVSQSNMAIFKMAANIKLSQKEWVKFFFCKWWEPILTSVSEFERKYYDGWIQHSQIQDVRIQDGCHHQV